MDFLPAIDLRHGQAVRLRQGDDAQATVYGDDPLVVLDRYVRAGVQRVHVVDLDATFGDPPQRELLEKIAGRKDIHVQLGGGLRDHDSILWALEAGCERVVVGSMVARDIDGFRALTLQHPGKLVPALDVEHGEVRIAGWTEGTSWRLPELCVRLHGLPCPAVLVTDVERDGMLSGPNFELARRVATASGIPALLSGGVRSLKDLEEARDIPEIAGAIVGRAIYEGVFTVEEGLATCMGGTQ